MKKLLYGILMIFVLLISENIYSQSDRYLKIEKNTMEGTKYGIRDLKTNSEIIPTIYDDIGDYSFDRFVVVKNNKIGVVDINNKIIIPLEYSFVSNYINDRTFLSNGSKMAMADEYGKILTSFVYDDVLGYSNSIIRVVQNNKIGYISNTGKTILPSIFINGDDCKGNFIVTYSNRIPTLYSKKGVQIYKGEKGEQIEIVPTGEIAFGDLYESGYYERKYTVIKANGEVMKPVYYRGLNIEDNWIKITTSPDSGWRYGIMSFTGDILLKPNFAKISDYDFDNGNLAKVEFPNGSFFFINKTVKCVEFNGQTCPE